MSTRNPKSAQPHRLSGPVRHTPRTRQKTRTVPLAEVIEHEFRPLVVVVPSQRPSRATAAIASAAVTLSVIVLCALAVLIGFITHGASGAKEVWIYCGPLTGVVATVYVRRQQNDQAKVVSRSD